MPRWMLQCPNCMHSFTHSKIDPAIVEEAFRDPFRILPRPTFASDGEKHPCPHCKGESIFQRHDLYYRDDASDFDF